MKTYQNKVNDIPIKEDGKSVTKRIGKLLTGNPGAVVVLLKKYDIQVEPATLGNIIAALTDKIVDDDEDFNRDLAEILANPRFSGIALILISIISTVIAGGFGLAKAGIGKRSQQETIEAKIRLSVMQQREAEKKRQAQLTLLVVGFALIIIAAVAYFTFKPIKTS